MSLGVPGKSPLTISYLYNMFSWEIYARCFTHTHGVGPKGFPNHHDNIWGSVAWRKRLNRQWFFCPVLIILGMIHISPQKMVDAPKFHIPLPIISQRGKKRQTKKSRVAHYWKTPRSNSGFGGNSTSVQHQLEVGHKFILTMRCVVECLPVKL